MLKSDAKTFGVTVFSELSVGETFMSSQFLKVFGVRHRKNF